MVDATGGQLIQGKGTVPEVDLHPPYWSTTLLTNQFSWTQREEASGVIDEGRPIFAQIAEHIENLIARGALAAGAQAPSINELARFFQINPATAAKGINELVDRGVLIKRRGIGMFVTPGARESILASRIARFETDYVIPLKAEATSLGITTEQLIDLITKKGPSE
jgi:DNA-binding transcriptional regulator YhcF (GntR family)